MTWGRAPLVWLAAGLAILLLTTAWPAIAAALSGRGPSGTVVGVWSASADPDRDQRIAESFAAEHPGWSLSIRFRESSSMSEAVYISFLAGNPPHVMDVPIPQLRDAVAGGMIRPIDDLLERTLREDPAFLDRRLGRDLEVLRFSCDPRDPAIVAFQRDGSQAVEAARLLNMHGRAIGFTALGNGQTLTWNRRLVGEAGRMFPELLDAQGRPRPPASWVELRRHAWCVAEWARRSEPDPARRPAGIILGGQKPRDARRLFTGLAATAGSLGFDFTPRPWIDGLARPAGRYAFSGPTFLGASGLVAALIGDGSAAPGIAARDFEATRTLLAQGGGAYLIDFSHAASRGATTVPDRIADIASAPLPPPWRDETERAALRALTGVDVGLGRPVRSMGETVTVLTTGVRGDENAAAAWAWMHYPYQRTQQIEGITTAYQQPRSRDVAEWLYRSADGDGAALRAKLPAFQAEVWAALEAGAPWPVEPGRKPVSGVDDPEVQFQALMLGAEASRPQGDAAVAAVVAAAVPGLARYDDGANRQIAEAWRGGADPGRFALAGWDPRDPMAGLRAQRSYAGNDAEVARLRGLLPEHLHGVTGPAGGRAWLHAVGLCLVAAALAGGLLLWWWWRSLSATPEERRWLRQDIVRSRWVWWFAAPGMLLASAFVFYPGLSLIWLSCFTGSGQGSLVWVGTQQFARLGQDATFWGQVLPTSIAYMLLVGGGQVIIALALALLLDLPLRGRGVYRTLLFIPMVTSLAVVSIVFYGLLAGPQSGVNQILGAVGIQVDGGGGGPIDWLNSERRVLGLPVALWSVMGVALWQAVPYCTILCLAGLQSVPSDLYEAARVDGAGAWARFRRITVPALTPVLVIILFNALVGAARAFGTVYIMTEGQHGTEIASTYIYKWGFRRTDSVMPDLGYAAAIGIAYMGLLATLAAINLTLVARRWRGRLGG
jgi:ABC-type sugar transport system permease subunit